MPKGNAAARTVLHGAYDAAAVVANDGADLDDGPTRALYIGGAGDVAVVMLGQAVAATPITFSAVAAGTILDVQVSRVMATNTTATLILALYSAHEGNWHRTRLGTTVRRGGPATAGFCSDSFRRSGRC